jgi:hypothetical protein
MVYYLTIAYEFSHGLQLDRAMMELLAIQKEHNIVVTHKRDGALRLESPKTAINYGNHNLCQYKSK